VTEIYVDHAQLEAAAQNFAQRREQLQNVLSTLEEGLAPMIASWAGSAQSMYLEKKAAWDTAAADLSTLLGGIARMTGEAHQGYLDVVATNQATWK
jgi:early secretory antigenic target protein ESAT-6